MLILIKKWNVCTKDDIFIDFVPPLIKRGLSEICKLALSSVYQLNMSYNVPSVYASQYGSWQQIAKLAEQFYKHQEFSPSGFSKTPHNAFAGILSIFYKNTLPYTVISAGNKTFEMGLVESITQQSEEIIYTYADESTPEVLHDHVSINPVSFSMLISQNSNGNYEIVFSNNGDVPTKTVYDFIEFLNGGEESFITSNFTITPRNELRQGGSDE
jgi:hypothetical protein